MFVSAPAKYSATCCHYTRLSLGGMVVKQSCLSLGAAEAAKRCYSCNYAKKGNNVYENFLIDYKKDCGDPFKKSNISTTRCSNDCYVSIDVEMMTSRATR